MSIQITSALLGLLALLSFSACSSSSDDSSSNGGTNNASGGSSTSGGTGGTGGDTSQGPTGTFLLELHPEDEYATITGQVFEGPTPNGAPLDVAAEQGGCQLLVPREIGCNPACAVGSVCTGLNTCTPKPAPKDVGTVHVEGIGDAALDLTASAPQFAYSGPTLADPYPPCKEGDDIKLTAPSFSITGKCISSLTLGGPTPIPVMSGKATELSWTPPGKTEISRIQIALEISHHGGYKGQVNCDVADTGSFTIPEPLVTGLIARGVGGYPSIKVTRISSAAASGLPGVTFVMPSLVERAVDHGVQSCGGQNATPCPSGKTCNQQDRLCH